MESALDWHSAYALLDWQVELGADEAIGDTPVDRFAHVEPPSAAKRKAAPEQPVRRKEIDAVEVARQAAQAAGSLDALREALGAYEHCALKRGARNLVFSDGHPAARVLILGEAPDRDEDREGRPFVGRAGRLLDRMLAAIDLDRTGETPDRAVYITNVLPWRPLQNRDPEPEEIAMMLPFVQKHIELVDPAFVILMGNIACRAALGKQGILRLRGTWTEAFGRPTLPMTHPTYLLQQPRAKREAWADLLSLKVRLSS
ncbi:uracil-DNA glycosylase [Pseudooceanicola batsensis HTCC2597]|uniref:Type-4 uracil-DNA glycosylase n=1 Tax=Pseudooceanicola batsensis (strain ATCC BAA-863 / DSM 15984 / KCTC 12145 / HTCC2597) TaxID=252305 RepID=A3TV89_PSEBH|nr:uracil-DNA glycosylase [Pseudooceanicola batsensis]EAQ04435.1 uracil-DNA glycosylase [Pseudooceanicola batsensis HTCC2597]